LPPLEEDNYHPQNAGQHSAMCMASASVFDLHLLHAISNESTISIPIRIFFTKMNQGKVFYKNEPRKNLKVQKTTLYITEEKIQTGCMKCML